MNQCDDKAAAVTITDRGLTLKVAVLLTSRAFTVRLNNIDRIFRITLPGSGIRMGWIELMTCQAQRYAIESDAEFLEVNRYPK